MDQAAVKEVFDRLESLYVGGDYTTENDGHVLLARHGYVLHDLGAIADKRALCPRRATGTTCHHALDSLIRHATAHVVPGTTAAYCSLAERDAKLTVVYNDHPANDEAGPADDGGWRDHRATYAFPLSDPWKLWTQAANRPLSVQEFAELLESGIADVRAVAAEGELLPGVKYASPAELLTLATGLSVRVEQHVVEQRRHDNGTATLIFAEEHKNEKGESLNIPNGFLLGLRVLQDGAAYALPVRLRYRIAKGQVTWILAPHEAEAVRREAIEGAAKTFAEATKLPLYFGTPDV